VFVERDEAAIDARFLMRTPASAFATCGARPGLGRIGGWQGAYPFAARSGSTGMTSTSVGTCHRDRGFLLFPSCVHGHREVVPIHEGDPRRRLATTPEGRACRDDESPAFVVYRYHALNALTPLRSSTHTIRPPGGHRREVGRNVGSAAPNEDQRAPVHAVVAS
jgi:hypothetical protein